VSSHNSIIHGDCLEVMKTIQTAHVDMILCDLPYGTTQNKWDVIIPLEEMWEQYKRVIKDDGAIVLFGQGAFTAKLIMSNPKMYRYSLVWEKSRVGGFLNARRMPLPKHEDIAVFYKKLPTYNPQMLPGEAYKKSNPKTVLSDNYGGHVKPRYQVSGGGRFPQSIVRFGNDNHGSLHPTQKPLELCKWLIATYTNPDDIVLDSCAGSGTTLLAAQLLGRGFIGIESDESYVEIIKGRLGHAQQLSF